MSASVLHHAPHYIMVDGHKITYHTAGNPANPPLMMVHGWLSHSRAWRRQMDVLQKTHFCVAIDLLGHGDSDTPKDGDYSIEAQGRRVLALADTLKLDRFALMGHSMGGQISLLIAGSLAPERVTHLIDVAGVLTGKLCWWPKYVTVPQMWLGKVAPFLVPPTTVMFRLSFVSNIVYGTWFYKTPPLSEWIEDRERTLQPQMVNAGYPAGIELQKTDVTPHLANIRAKTLVILGRHDRVVPISEGQLAAGGISGAQLEWFEESGHFPHFEATDAFNQSVTKFLIS